MNYVAGQIGRSARVNLGHRHDSRYVGAKAIAHSRSLLDIGFLTENRGILEPLDKERFFDPKRSFVAVATNCLTGKPEYFEKGKCDDIILAVRASATMPIISSMVEIGDVPYLDGGCSCKIPYQWALDQGFEKIVVVRTRDKDFRKKNRSHPAALKLYKDYPAFAESLANSAVNYNRQCDDIERLHDEGRLLRIAPFEPVMVTRLERDMEKLGDLYWLGWYDCIDSLELMKDYLAV
jgi:predicted patatin/cPLA2 family phospholipase